MAGYDGLTPAVDLPAMLIRKGLANLNLLNTEYSDAFAQDTGGQDEDRGEGGCGEGGEVDGETVAASGCVLWAVAPPVAGDEPGHPPDVGEQVAAEQDGTGQEADLVGDGERAEGAGAGGGQAD